MLLTESEQYPIETLRHSFAHVLAHAVSRLYPGAKLGIGPATKTGFYYDIDIPEPLKEQDLENIKQEMQKIIEEDLQFTQLIVQREQAETMLLQLGQTYKSELLKSIPHDDISFYKTGEQFIDLCSGPHVRATGDLRYFELISISGAYWQGDNKRPQLQRIAGVAFKTKPELESFISLRAEMDKSDHRKLGPEMDMFHFEEEINPNIPIWHQDGTTLYKVIQDFISLWFIHNDFELHQTPQLIKSQNNAQKLSSQFNISNKLPDIKLSNGEYSFKSDNYISSLELFVKHTVNIAELPKKIAEVSSVFNYASDESGLLKSQQQLRPTGMVISHESIISTQLIDSIRLVDNFLRSFGFSNQRITLHVPDYNDLSKYRYEEQYWEDAISITKNVIKENNYNLQIVEADCYYYGPRIAFKVKDKFERYWDIASIGIDLIHPKELQISCINLQGEKEPAILLNIALLESVEKMIALLLEHTAGSLPLWLAPNQVAIIPISEQYYFKAEKFYNSIKDQDIRVYLDNRDEKMEMKIRDAQLKQVPYMVIIGEKETSTNSISVRPRAGAEIGLMRVNEFVKKLKEDISNQQ